MKPKAPGYSKHGLAQTVVALLVLTTASIFVPFPAMADPPESGADKDATGNQDPADESNRTNNGSDTTRPQNAFEMRPFDRTSSNDTSKTNDAEMLLRMTSKILLGAG
jgi:hypothetical protein